MLLTEYNEAETMELFKRDYLAEGMAQGRAEGMAQGQEAERLSGIRNLMKSLKISAQQAMTLLGIPEAEQTNYLNRI